MPGEPLPSVEQLLAARAGEELALNDRYLNPQMGRILRTLGFDKVWSGGEGAHLIDSDGERYLDLFGGYGVFAIGRNHPEAIAAVEQVMAARTGNLPQLGVTLLSGVLAEQLLARAPDSVAAMVPANTRHRGGGGGDQDRPRRHRPPARAVCRARLPRADARLPVAQRRGGVPRRVRAAAARLRPRGLRRPRRAGARAGPRGRGGVRGRAGPGQGREPSAGGVSAGRPEAVPRSGRTVRVRRGADGHRPHRPLPGARALGPSAGHDLPRQGAVRRARADRRGARLAGGVRQRVRRHGARRPPRLDLRRQRPRGGRRAGDAAGARPARGWWHAPSALARCCWS